MDKLLFSAIFERDEVVMFNIAGAYMPVGRQTRPSPAFGPNSVVEAQSIHSNFERKWSGGAAVEQMELMLGVIGMGGFGIDDTKGQ